MSSEDVNPVSKVSDQLENKEDCTNEGANIFRNVQLADEVEKIDIYVTDDFETSKSSEEESVTELQDDLSAPAEVIENGPKTFQIADEEPRLTEDDGWLDIFGSGDFKKHVTKQGNGTRIQAKNLVILNYICYDSISNRVLEQAENCEVIVGDLDVVKGLDLALPIMEHDESAEILIPSRLAYAKTGRPPDVPPDCDVRYEVEVIKVEEIPDENLTPADVIKYGNQKRSRGNFWYERGDYTNAVHCYKRAAEFLDGGYDGSESSSDVLQEILDTRIKVYNNLAVSQLKLESYDQALKSVDFVLRIQPQNVKALFRKVKILMAKGFTEEAIQCARKAAELEPETKVIQQELTRLTRKKKMEDKSQQEMYKRMFRQSSNKSHPSKAKKWIKRWTLMAGSCLAVAIGVVAYRQYYL